MYVINKVENENWKDIEFIYELPLAENVDYCHGLECEAMREDLCLTELMILDVQGDTTLLDKFLQEFKAARTYSKLFERNESDGTAFGRMSSKLIINGRMYDEEDKALNAIRNELGDARVITGEPFTTSANCSADIKNAMKAMTANELENEVAPEENEFDLDFDDAEL